MNVFQKSFKPNILVASISKRLERFYDILVFHYRFFFFAEDKLWLWMTTCESYMTHISHKVSIHIE